MEQEGFLTTPRIAMLFFRVCRRYKVQHPEDRLLLLRQLARRKKVKYIRDVSALTRGKRVLRISAKPPHNAGPEHICPECRPFHKDGKGDEK